MYYRSFWVGAAFPFISATPAAGSLKGANFK